MKSLLLLSVLLFLPLVSFCQSPYYYHTGDTIVGRSPIYFYQWWEDTWLADTSHKLGIFKMTEDIPLIIDTVHNMTIHPDYLPHGEILQYCYTDHPIEIIGIATSAVVGYYHSGYPVELEGDPDFTEYLRIYDATEEDFILLKEVPYDRHIEKRYMKIDNRMQYDPMGAWGGIPGGYVNWPSAEAPCCDDTTINYSRHMPFREHYFEKPVQVSDSFYVGITTEGQFNWTPINYEGPHLGPLTKCVSGFMLYWGENLHKPGPHGGTNCTNTCPPPIPTILHKYRDINWQSAQPLMPDYGDTLDKNWHWLDSYSFMLEFPIVVIDSSYIIPPYECPPVTNVRIADQEEGTVLLLWDTHNDHNGWQISYGPAGIDPDSGTIVNCPIQVGRAQGLDSCTHYSAFVRAVCNHDSVCYSRWSDPLDIYICDTVGDDTTSIVSALDALTYIIPNPANDLVQVMSSFSISRIEAYSLYGRCMLDTKASGISAAFSVKGWPSGTYVVIIHTPAGNAAKKLVVN